MDPQGDPNQLPYTKMNPQENPIQLPYPELDPQENPNNNQLLVPPPTPYYDFPFVLSPYIAVSNEMGCGYTSPQSTASDPVMSSHLQAEERVEARVDSESKKKVSRYRNATPGVVSRRRAQNRASQRAYRERKEQRIRDLESQVLTLQTHTQALRHRGKALAHDFLALQEENARLRASLAGAGFDVRPDAAAAVYQGVGFLQGFDASRGMAAEVDVGQGQFRGLQVQMGVCPEGNAYNQPQPQQLPPTQQQLTPISPYEPFQLALDPEYPSPHPV
ncbi:hypothetical protein CDD80_4987 [Ophiocordyceps camponoti-rufipedis]|uniref:BZIP domain-containing protein n=1 Tax=Ophiocordyceps camponoti-rufipedis TaxID=2004952 RepID=A0A2C5YVN3_9HYPO|nr:hypothetical protein CDD80_4987 [Ophiocordyceps camponoti-rufipedis]